MSFKEITTEIAKCAQDAVIQTIRGMKRGNVHDEDDITGALVGSLHSKLDGFETAGIRVQATVLRHRRGAAAQESKIGADLLLHVSMDTPTQMYSKGALIQAKKSEPGSYFSRRKFEDLVGQCKKMLHVTPAAFVMNYSERGFRCGSATRISGASPADLSELCEWTSYRFFLELLRCPIGDSRITSASVEDLNVPYALSMRISESTADAELFELK